MLNNVTAWIEAIDNRAGELVERHTRAVAGITDDDDGDATTRQSTSRRARHAKRRAKEAAMSEAAAATVTTRSAQHERRRRYHRHDAQRVDTSNKHDDNNNKSDNDAARSAANDVDNDDTANSTAVAREKYDDDTAAAAVAAAAQMLPPAPPALRSDDDAHVSPHTPHDDDDDEAASTTTTTTHDDNNRSSSAYTSSAYDDSDTTTTTTTTTTVASSSLSSSQPRSLRALDADALKLQCASMQQRLRERAEQLHVLQQTLAQREADVTRLQRAHDEATAALQRAHDACADAQRAQHAADAQLHQLERERVAWRDAQAAALHDVEVYKAHAQQLLVERDAALRQQQQQQQQQHDERHAHAPCDDAATGQLRAQLRASEQRVTELQAALDARTRDADARAHELRELTDAHAQTQLLLRTRELELRAAQAALHDDGVTATTTMTANAACDEASDATTTTTRVQQQQQQDNDKVSGGGRVGVAAPSHHHNDNDNDDDDDTSATSAAEATKLSDALADAQQRCQQLSYQVMQQRAALQASERDVAEWQQRYHALQTRVEHDEAAVVVAVVPPSLRASGECADGHTATGRLPSSMRDVYSGGGRHSRAARSGGSGGVTARLPFAAHTHAPMSLWGSSSNSNNNSYSNDGDGMGSLGLYTPQLQRSRLVLALAHRGVAARLLVNVACGVDDVARRVVLRLLQYPVLRVLTALYVACLHAWWLALLLASLAS